MKESEDVTWDRFLEALTSVGKGDLAKSVREKYLQVKQEDLDEEVEEEEKKETAPKDKLVRLLET